MNETKISLNKNISVNVQCKKPVAWEILHLFLMQKRHKVVHCSLGYFQRVSSCRRWCPHDDDQSMLPKLYIMQHKPIVEITVTLESPGEE